MNTEESNIIFSLGYKARVEGEHNIANPYPKNGSGAWLMWCAGWMAANRDVHNL